MSIGYYLTFRKLFNTKTRILEEIIVDIPFHFEKSPYHFENVPRFDKPKIKSYQFDNLIVISYNNYWHSFCFHLNIKVKQYERFLRTD